MCVRPGSVLCVDWCGWPVSFCGWEHVAAPRSRASGFFSRCSSKHAEEEEEEDDDDDNCMPDCNLVNSNEMVLCDDCERWYHFECVGLSSPPQTKQWCVDTRVILLPPLPRVCALFRFAVSVPRSPCVFAFFSSAHTRAGSAQCAKSSVFRGGPVFGWGGIHHG